VLIFFSLVRNILLTMRCMLQLDRAKKGEFKIRDQPRLVYLTKVQFHVAPRPLYYRFRCWFSATKTTATDCRDDHGHFTSRVIIN
jgi:hypothetical protein